MNIESQINILKEKIKEKYPDLYMGYSYDANEDYYHIWHINSHLQYEDDHFLDFVGSLIKEHFYSKDIFNFSFGYDYMEDEKSKLVYEVTPNLNNFIIKVGNFFESKETNYYHLIKEYIIKHYSLNWSNSDSIDVIFDAKDSSFCTQIRQAPLTREAPEDPENMSEEALAA